MDYKLVIAVRSDLELSRGKLADGVSPDEAFKRLEEALK